MSDTYKAVTRIKTGTKDDGFEYIERGEEVSAADFDGDEEYFDSLVAGGSVMEADRYDVLFPEAGGPVAGNLTPSNLSQVTGTDLAADPEEGGVGDVDAARNEGTAESEEDSKKRQEENRATTRGTDRREPGQPAPATGTEASTKGDGDKK